MMNKFLAAAVIVMALSSFAVDSGLTGRWEYSGGIYNGKPEAAPKDYTLRRQYDAEHYAALFMEKDAKPFTYEAGNYKLQQDTCFETQTFSAQPSKLLNITVKYRYQIRNDSLIFNGTLPNGTVVQEYWKRVK